MNKKKLVSGDAVLFLRYNNDLNFKPLTGNVFKRWGINYSVMYYRAVIVS